MAKMITTNLRIEVNDYLQMKARAGEMGMSVNEYFNYLIEEGEKSQILGKRSKQAKKMTVYDALLRLARKKYTSKPMGANDDDKIIYGIDD